MSAARPVRGLVARAILQSSSPNPTTSTVPNSLLRQCRAIHNTAPRQRRGSRFRNVKAEQLGLLNSPEKMDKFKAEHMPEYTEQEIAALRKKYTQEQIEAIKAGEKAVDAEDVLIQGRLREDLFRPKYVDDFAAVDPRLDLKPELEGTPREPRWDTEEQFEEEYFQRLTGLMSKKSGDQLTRAMIRALRKVKQSQGDQELIDLTDEELADMERDPSLAQKYLISPDKTDAQNKKDDKKIVSMSKAVQLDALVDEAWKKELEQLAATTTTAELAPTNFDLLQDGPDGTIRMHTAEAVELGKVPGVAGLYKTTTAEEDQQDDQGEYTELKQLTGLSIDEIRSIYTNSLVIRWVHNQTRLGKIRSVSVMAIAGNGNGRLGIGVGKSVQMDVASRTATMLAIRNMKPVRRYENRTIYGNITSKMGGTVVELAARPPGMCLTSLDFP
jgi:small subunit ribosomal protein S5